MRRFTAVMRIAAALLACTAIALLAACSGSSTVEKTQSAGRAQASMTVAKNELSLDEAIDAALADAGVERENAVFSQAKLDSDEAEPHYDIEFTVTADGVATEYDYEILAAGGKVIKHEREVKGGKAASTEATAKPSTPGSASGGGYIGVDDAKAAALSHAKLTAGDVKFVKAKFDGDDIVPHYDIEFVGGTAKYDYEIGAADGRVMEYEIESGTSGAADPAEYIGAEKAKKAALDHAGLAESQVRELKAELDIDGTIAHYDVEFVSGGFEYEYEINAKTGSIIASEKERD